MWIAYTEGAVALSELFWNEGEAWDGTLHENRLAVMEGGALTCVEFPPRVNSSAWAR